MSSEDFNTYEELPEEEKRTYRPVNERGDYVRRSAVENFAVANRIAHLENEAFGELEASVARSGISVSDIIQKMNAKGLSYDEKGRLREMLFEISDLQRLKGNPVDDQIEPVLKKSYESLRYSKVLRSRLVNGIEVGDADVIGEILKDEKMGSEYEVVGKLANDEQRKDAFAICKDRLRSACLIIEHVEDINLALALYRDALSLVDPESYSDRDAIESSGKKLANRLFAEGDTQRIIDLVEAGMLQLSYCKKFFHRLSGHPQDIIDLVKTAHDVGDVYQAIKFITDPALLDQLASDVGQFAHLEDEERSAVAEYSKNIAHALNAKPEVIALSELRKDKDKDKEFLGLGKQAQNKFVVGIRNGKYVIAWSNMEETEYHREIFEKIGRTVAKSGGYVGIDEKDGKTKIRLVRSSGDYGYYSRELLERCRGAIENSLKDVLGGQQFELVINESSDYE